MVRSELETTGYFRRLGLELTAMSPLRQATGLGGGYRLTYASDRAYAIGGATAFASLEALWDAWRHAQPLLAHNERGACLFARSSLGWTSEQRRLMDRWLEDKGVAGDPRIVYCVFNRNRWPWLELRSVGPGEPNSLREWSWNSAAATLPVSDKAVADESGWAETALRKGRFDLQRPAVFGKALSELIEDAPRAALDATVARAVCSRAARPRL